MSANIQLLIVDDQNDFMDTDTAALRVKGASDDAERTAAFVDREGWRITHIGFTLDSHPVIDLGHPGMWCDADGQPPAPFTVITAQDIRDRVWNPRNENSRRKVLGGRTIREYFIDYADQLEKRGKYQLTVWPEHCIIGTEGHNVQPRLRTALSNWERRRFADVNWVTKGTNPWTEHYGALEAEVPMATDPSTLLNAGYLGILKTADLVIIVGQARTHCVLETMRQVVYNVPEAVVRKIVLLTDCTSDVAAIPGVVDFSALADAEISKMQQLGLQLATSDQVFS